MAGKIKVSRSADRESYTRSQGLLQMVDLVKNQIVLFGFGLNGSDAGFDRNRIRSNGSAAAEPPLPPPHSPYFVAGGEEGCWKPYSQIMLVIQLLEQLRPLPCILQARMAEFRAQLQSSAKQPVVSESSESASEPGAVALASDSNEASRIDAQAQFKPVHMVLEPPEAEQYSTLFVVSQARS